MGNLFAAASQGDIECIKDYINSGTSSIDDKDERGATALHWAALNQQFEVCNYLLDKGIDVNSPTVDLRATPLHWAAKRGLVQMVNYLVQRGGDPLIQDSQGFHCLHLAVHSSNSFLVVYLLHLDIPVDSPDENRHTPLMWAVYHGNELVTNCLLKWGANVHATDNENMTPLHWSLVGAKPKCIRLILQECGLSGARAIADLSGQLKTPWALSVELGVSKQFREALVVNGLKVQAIVNEPIEKYQVVPINHQFSRRAYFRLPFAASFPILGIAFLIMSVCPFVLSVFLAPAWIYLSCKFIIYYVESSTEVALFFIETPFLAGLFSSTFFWVWSHACVYILPVLYRKKFFLFVTFLFLSFLCIAYYVNAVFQDPGYVPTIGGITQRRECIEDLLGKSIFDQNHFCLRCLHPKPNRSFHCIACDRCVYRYDHHCPWISNCVGLKNHKVFLIYTLLLAVLIPLYCYAAFVYLSVIPIQEKYESYTCMFVRGIFCEWLLKDMFVIVAIFVVSINWFWVLSLSFTQLWQVAHNMTTAEYRLFQRYKSFSAPTSQGMVVRNPNKHRHTLMHTLAALIGLDQYLLFFCDVFRFFMCRSKTPNPSFPRDLSLSSANPHDKQSVYKNCMYFWRGLSDEQKADIESNGNTS
ncbi:palmitoyltransferase [Schizosaccharomyces cryophilus OY26]|uniref:Palmitoyltransferase n=1 Tax=Schizosaccharomyces cryophilus (strain OY26 / ATCC MYA-4695 / CBS 11777 / NBRC 106824 / NRRL Y48691) TaxID=653667 RepID=S9W8G5_SCHCR|nr:palmitoyltransferase [Schizosaccharomyces cryophilus OY26]EPY54155.1 palmitoyltransferase [Schizosaccharomyces cryophilus OY26]